MRHPSTPANSSTPRSRTRGAIRTHLGRKRTGPRGRPPRRETYVGMQQPGTDTSREVDLCDQLRAQFQSLFDAAGETTAVAFEKALDAACDTLVAAGDFTRDNAERLRHYLKRDLLQRDHPGMTFRSGEITSAGTLTCEGCGWTLQTSGTAVVPPCPRCAETSFRKTA